MMCVCRSIPACKSEGKNKKEKMKRSRKNRTRQKTNFLPHAPTLHSVLPFFPISFPFRSPFPFCHCPIAVTTVLPYRSVPHRTGPHQTPCWTSGKRNAERKRREGKGRERERKGMKTKRGKGGIHYKKQWVVACRCWAEGERNEPKKKKEKKRCKSKKEKAKISEGFELGGAKSPKGFAFVYFSALFLSFFRACLLEVDGG